MNNKQQQHVQCEVCQKQVAKYKCPKCVARYCSVGCYKTHKEKECSPLKIIDIPKNCVEPSVKLIQNESIKLESKEDGQLSDSQEEEFTESEDRVANEKLQTLGDSEHMLALLENPHLRTIMTSMYHSADPKKLLETAMKEPIFTEFADECLRLVDQGNS